MSTNSEKRAQRKQASNHESNEIDDARQSWWQSWFDRKQIGATIVGVVLGAILSGIALFFSGIWSMYSENTENRITTKLETSDAFANKIAAKIQTGNTLATAIVAQLRSSEEIKSIKTISDEIGKLKDRIGEENGKIRERLASIDEKIRSLERDAFASKASALGIKNPDIRTIALKPTETFETKTTVSAGLQFVMRYTIVKIEGNSIYIKFDYSDSKGNKAWDNIIRVEAVPGRIYNLSVFGFSGLPKVLLAILARPTPETAVIATGQADSKAS